MKTDLLDHGYCRLVSYTQPIPSEPFSVVYQDGQGSAVMRDGGWTGDLEIVRAARTSYNADWRAGEDEGKDEKLIHTLWKRKHTTPFESMSFSFEIQAPIFVFRQWHRHRTQSYNEVSARYTELPDLFYLPDADQVRAQSLANKQGRDGELPAETVREYRERCGAQYTAAYLRYQQFLAAGVSRELARVILPFGIYSRMYATANLLNWFRFLDLRTDSHAQYEIRVFADAMLEMLRSVCPIALAAFDRYKWVMVDREESSNVHTLTPKPDAKALGEAFFGENDG